MTKQSKEIKALDLEIETPCQVVGVAYYRLPKEVKEFFELCEAKHGIAGFEWEVGSWNFGVMLKNNDKTK